MKKNKTNTSSIPKIIIFTAKFLEKLSPYLAAKFAKKLFITPIKHKIPKREFHMEHNSIQNKLFIPKINKEINIFEYGKSDKKILLVHGWSGRGTQLVKIADKLLEMDYSTISFDAPAHGKSKGKTTIMTEFIECILELEKKYGKFYSIIGHSLGGMATLNAIKRGLKVENAIIISSGDSVLDIVNNFIQKLKLNPTIALKLQKFFEKESEESMENYSSYVAAKHVSIPVLVIHDKDDDDVPYEASINISRHLSNSKLFLTENLGHRKILGDKCVIQEIENFISN